MRLKISRLGAAAVLLPALTTAVAEPQSLEQQLANAATLKGPAGALMTFQLIDTCVSAKRGDAMSTYDAAQKRARPYTEAELSATLADCAGLTDELAEARMDYLDRAVKGHAEGAAAVFVSAGPGGDKSLLHTRPHDPQVVAWKKQAVDYLAEAALQGDLSSMIHLQSYQINPEDMGAPLTLIYAAHNAVVHITQVNPFKDTVPAGKAEAILKLMTPEQRAAVQTLSGDMVAANQKRQEPPPATALN